MTNRRHAGKLYRGIAGLCLAVLLSSPALAAGGLLPQGFFQDTPKVGTGPAVIEADTLSYNGDTKVISAEGGVVLNHMGYTAEGDRLVYNQSTGALTFIGNVVLKHPSGMVYTTDYADITGGMKEGFLQSLTITTPDGALITAKDTRFGDAISTMLIEATYSPCGLCVDAKGRKIGWRVKAAKMTFNGESKSIDLEQPVLELLGIPMAWLPYLSLPDPTQTRANGLRMPSVDYTDKTGFMLTVPYFWAAGLDTDIIFTPTLVSRQGLLMGAEWVQRWSMGTTSLKASGIYQMESEVFGREVRDRDWRGAIQTTGRFEPLDNWTAGWSYTAFTDTGYLTDYKLVSSTNRVNQVYATHLESNTYADIRAQHFTLLGDNKQNKQKQQALTLPNARYDNVLDLPDEYGQLSVVGRLLAVQRDATQKIGPYVLGHAGDKVHGMGLVSWQNQWIVPGGIAATPYLGIRADGAFYDPQPSPDRHDKIWADGAQSLFAATPIAALDLRYPLMATNGGDTHIIEPIGQLVYRGSNETRVGITNDNAQSFVLDDTNLFSYDRFTGSDRQETGLRANIGLRYQANFADGGWLELLAGQSFHLAGTNSYDTVDTARVGMDSGLDADASHVVLGAKGTLFGLLEGGGKLLLDPENGDVARAAAVLNFENEAGYSLDFSYAYLHLPTLDNEQHEVGGVVGVPIQDYWRLTAGLHWDLVSNNWLEASAGVLYDDGYLQFGARYSQTGPTHINKDEHRFTASFKLKTPDGTLFSF